MARWATPPMDREQMAMFSPTLDAMIPADHPVRVFDEILRELDWSDWESVYDGQIGQPPIHPRVVAGVILYGLSLGMRSSRALERGCGNTIDFMWLTSGRVIDHATICGFRTRFRQALKKLFRQIGRVARAMGLIRLNQVGLDGTRVLANSSRHGTRTAKSLAAEESALDELVEQMLTASEQADHQEDEAYGVGESANVLPRELSEYGRRQERLQAALAAARTKDLDATKPSKVPVADPDSTIQPNKEGGFAPNYTPLATVDGQTGMIVDTEVLADGDEGRQTVATVDRVEEAFGEKPRQLLADSAHGSGANLAGLAERGVDAYIPLEQRADRPDNPAHRADPTQPVPAEQWDQLPVSPRTKMLDRAAFVYDEVKNCYYCPMGRALPRWRLRDKRSGCQDVCQQYRCSDCGDCPLQARCVQGSEGRRTITRDQHESLREQMDAKLRTESGRAAYGHRRWICETVFGTIKGVMGVRRFLLRGLEKVRAEWDWVCTAFNLGKLARAISALRARLAVQKA
jgi:transposase